MYQKFWKQFLSETRIPGESRSDMSFGPTPAPQAEPTFDLGGGETKPDEPEVPQRREQTGIRAFLTSRGFQYDKFLGGGQDGRVIRAYKVDTGQRFAIKFINTATTNLQTARREVENYSFVKDNRDSFGENAKYLPIVYKAEMAAVPPPGETMDGRLVFHGVIYMEELEPLPSEVAKNLFAVGGNSPRIKAAKEKRDKRLFKNPKLVSSLLNIAWGLTDPGSTTDFLSLEAQDEAEKKIMSKFFKGDYDSSVMQNDPYVRRSQMGEQAKNLMSLYIDITYQEMLAHPEDETSLDIIRDYESHIKEDLLMSFFQAYMKPLVTGAAGRRLDHGSGLRGLDNYYARSDELEKEFPEIVGVRAAMQAFADRDSKPFDVHAANVMMRPGTNDIVIVDLGRFNV